jgi:hypothetical protein
MVPMGEKKEKASNAKFGQNIKRSIFFFSELFRNKVVIFLDAELRNDFSLHYLLNNRQQYIVPAE